MATVVLACAACLSWPAAAQTIVVTPGSVHPGDRVHISVPGCGVGPTQHVAVSTAFTANVTLYGKADTGDADPALRQDLKPGTYPITAYCGARSVQGLISVTAGERPSSGTDDDTDNWLLLVVVIVLAGVASVFLLGRRGRRVS